MTKAPTFRRDGWRVVAANGLFFVNDECLGKSSGELSRAELAALGEVIAEAVAATEVVA